MMPQAIAKALAYGTFPAPFLARSRRGQDSDLNCRDALAFALLAGCRHLDTAFTYANQHLIGPAVLAAALPRSQVFVASKLHPYNNSYPEARDRLVEAVTTIWGSPNGYLDAFLIHYPGFGDPAGAWRAILEARDAGLVHHPGVSNFEIWHLQKLFAQFGTFPEVNQIEFHPLIYPQQADLLRFCFDHGIRVEGYSPLAEGAALNLPSVLTLARQYTTSPTRVLLRWCQQHGVKPIVGSRNANHIRDNFRPFDFSLTTAEIEKLNQLGDAAPLRVSSRWNWNPKAAPFGGPVPRPSRVRRWLARLRSMLSR